MKTVTAIIMASGLSQRMGEDKLLMDFRGKPLYRHVQDTLAKMDLSEVIVVSKTEEILKYAHALGFTSIYNENYIEGQSSSIVKGLEVAEDTDGFMFFVSDQPFISKATIFSMLEAFESADDECIILPLYGGEQGSPGLFSSRYKSELLRLKADETGRKIAQKYQAKVCYVQRPEKIESVDIDDSKDYKRYAR